MLKAVVLAIGIGTLILHLDKFALYRGVGGEGIIHNFVKHPQGVVKVVKLAQ